MYNTFNIFVCLLHSKTAVTTKLIAEEGCSDLCNFPHPKLVKLIQIISDCDLVLPSKNTF